MSIMASTLFDDLELTMVFLYEQAIATNFPTLPTLPPIFLNRYQIGSIEDLSNTNTSNYIKSESVL